jgi:hypothetical protein
MKATGQYRDDNGKDKVVFHEGDILCAALKSGERVQRKSPGPQPLWLVPCRTRGQSAASPTARAQLGLPNLRQGQELARTTGRLLGDQLGTTRYALW